ncbi:uncharacterized protein P174DRAFT_464269 [Aspergillus novofumigatus IBT 16806]|uniref:Protein kinase domain-containing protein n=1 Tax=Aspergillus novofumigatus (strain IBT 16806) TaxID=1392255 RepID=A0A2I1BWR7_ASPN1|nr:uncharacterized protein P174DRAFT_464269 [Aspergillus novofumigatus IBT 16806]PKX89834.1 hypothetical protein P174DRAFT_464269 [Aspergillus novofumigatus IBT 16806]
MATAPNEYIVASGSCCWFKGLLQERPHMARVWLATSDLIPVHLEKISLFRKSYRNIFLRTFMRNFAQLQHLVNLFKKGLPLQARKQFLKATLRGIAELHNRDVVHPDIEPDNIIVEFQHSGQDFTQSPEAHFKGQLNKPTDFSFIWICLYLCYAQTRVLFGLDEGFRKHQTQGALPAFSRMQRQAFPDVVDPALKDLIQGFTTPDSVKRVTACQALEHPGLRDD